MSVGEHRIVFTPSGLSGTVAHGTTVLDAARRLGADLDTVCGGRGICGRCQVVPGVGTFAKWAITVDARRALAHRRAIETDYHGSRPLRRRASPRLRGARSTATSWSTSRRRARSTARSSARTSTCRRSSVDPMRSPLLYVELDAAGARSRAPASRRPSIVGRGRGRAARLDADADGVASACWPTCTQSPVKGGRRDGRGRRVGRRVVAIWPGFVDTRVRGRRSTSGRPRSPATSATSRPARCSRRPGG